jgi:hypothetical protein
MTKLEAFPAVYSIGALRELDRSKFGQDTFFKFWGREMDFRPIDLGEPKSAREIRFISNDNFDGFSFAEEGVTAFEARFLQGDGVGKIMGSPFVELAMSAAEKRHKKHESDECLHASTVTKSFGFYHR